MRILLALAILPLVFSFTVKELREHRSLGYVQFTDMEEENQTSNNSQSAVNWPFYEGD